MYRASISNKFNSSSLIAVSNNLAFSGGISMTFTLQDLKHLEIMAELEDMSVLVPEEEPVATVVSAPVSLTENLLLLATKLRTAGFTSQADSLENTFGMYKKAEVDANLLYRAHSETGDDLLEFAHPDGDVEVAPAQDHNGDVETLQSKHEKIVDVVQKTAQTNNNPIPHTALVQKFEYLKNFVASNYLKTPSPEEENTPQYKSLLEVASDVFNLASELEKQFRAPGSSPEYLVVEVITGEIHEMLNNGENNPKFTTMGDINVFINQLLAKLQSMVPSKKTAILNMLKKTLNIKTAQAPAIQNEALDTLYAQGAETLKKFREIYASILTKLDEETDFNDMYLNVYEHLVKRQVQGGGKFFTVYDDENAEKALTVALDQLIEEFGPGMFSTSGKKRLWKDEIVPMIGFAQRYVLSWTTIIANIRKIETATKTSNVKQYDPDAKAEQAAAQESANDPFNMLISSMDKAVAAIDHKTNMLTLSKQEGSDKTLVWLAKAKSLIVADKTALMANPEKKNKEVVDFFTAKFNAKNEKLKAAGVN